MNQMGLGLVRAVNSVSNHQGGQEDLDLGLTWEDGFRPFSNSKLGSLRLGPTSSNSIQSDPGPLSCLQCNDCWPTTATSEGSKKRLRKDFGRFGRNLRQCLLCGFFSKVDIGHNHKSNTDTKEEDQVQVQSTTSNQNDLYPIYPN